MECDVADAEFPRKPPKLEDVLRRSLTDNFRSRAAVRERFDMERPVTQQNGYEAQQNGFDMSNPYETAMNSGTNVNMRRLQEQLDRQPLDEIAMLVRALTYGEMIELAEGMWKVQAGGSAVTQENLPSLLHRWSQSRTLAAAGDPSRDPESV
jgi:hypothetical protein